MTRRRGSASEDADFCVVLAGVRGLHGCGRMAEVAMTLGGRMTVYLADADFTLHHGDVQACLADMPDESVHCVVTSPPYWGLRDYGAEGQIGLEATPELYVARMVEVFREVRRVLRSDGVLWLNLGDSYYGGGSTTEYGQNTQNFIEKSTIAGTYTEGQTSRPVKPRGHATIKQKDMVGIPWMVAFALRADGWYLRSEVIWSKPNPMPESVTDRPTKAHEQVFLLTKSARYFYDADAIREPAANLGPTEGLARNQARGASGKAGRNARSVWEIATQPYPEAHFATFPQELARRCIVAGCPEGGVVLDPFLGSGTTAFVARAHGRQSIGIELNADYCALAARRMQQQSLLAGGPDE